MPASAIVAFEQALPTVLLAPFVWRGIRRALRVFDLRDWLALIVLGCGSSALATLLFTVAFTYGRPNTPVLLQQLQPLFAVAGARVLLGERLQRRYGLYLLGGLAGSYLVAFAHPFSLDGVDGWAPALLAVSAALLWGLGTVLGRRLGAKLPFAELTALRLATGLIAALVALGVTGDASSYSAHQRQGRARPRAVGIGPGPVEPARLLPGTCARRLRPRPPSASWPSPSRLSSSTTWLSEPLCHRRSGWALAFW